MHVLDLLRDKTTHAGMMTLLLLASSKGCTYAKAECSWTDCKLKVTLQGGREAR